VAGLAVRVPLLQLPALIAQHRSYQLPGGRASRDRSAESQAPRTASSAG